MSTTTVGYEVEYSEGMTKAVQAKQNKDVDLLEVAELCSKVADRDLP